MKALKYILRILVGIGLGIYFIGLLLVNIPAVQSRLGSVISDALSTKLQTRVHVGQVQLGMWNRVIVDDVTLYDQRDTLMLQVARVAAKVEILPFLEHKVRISNAQLFGTKAVLYKPSQQEPHNFQFVIDALARKDTTRRHPIDLQIGSLLVRRCNVQYDQLWQPSTPGRFNVHHIRLRDFSMNAQLRQLTPDTLNASVKRLAFREESGLQLDHLNLQLSAGRHNLALTDMELALPHSTLNIPTFTASYNDFPRGNFRSWIQQAEYQGAIQLDVTPQDLQSVAPALAHFQDALQLQTELNGQQGVMHISRLVASDSNHNVDLTANGEVYLDSRNLQVQIQQLKTGTGLQQFITRNLKGEEREVSPFLTRLGATETSGTVRKTGQELAADMKVSTAVGAISAKGTLVKKNHIQAEVNTDGFQLGNLLNSNGKSPIDKLSVQASVKGDIKGADNRPNLTAEGVIKELELKGYPYRNVQFSGSCHGKEYTAQLGMEDQNGDIQLEGTLDMGRTDKNLQCTASIQNLSPYNLNLTKKYENDRFSMNLKADVAGSDINNAKGTVLVRDLILDNTQTGVYKPGDILVTSFPDSTGQHVSLESPMLSLQADGAFHWQNVHRTFLQITNAYLPSIFPSSGVERKLDDEISFTIHAQDTALVRRLTGKSISLPEEAVIAGKMDGGMGLLSISANIPTLNFGREQLRHLDWRMESTQKSLQTSMTIQRMIKDKPVDIGVDAFTDNDQLMTNLHWNNHLQPVQSGEVSIAGEFYRDLDNKQAIRGHLNPSDIVISDTVWNIHPGTINYHDGVIDVQNVKVSQGDRYVDIAGRVSREEGDTLIANLHRINMAYIFNIINFHTVDFTGEATGTVYAKTLLKAPHVDAYAQVRDFTFNGGDMGTVDAHFNWGDHDKSLWLDGQINDPKADHQTTLEGTITPGKRPDSGLDLHIKSRHVNIYFMNKFVANIFSNFRGRATGWIHLYGPFKHFDLEGELVADECAMYVNSLGTEYHMMGDSLIMKPGHIWIRHATAYDKLGGPSVSDHRGTVDGVITHDHFKNIQYKFDITAQNILGYDFHDFGDNNFYGTVFATGKVHLEGQPGIVNVDMDGTPTSGTIFVYNVHRPETLTEAGFLTYVDHNKPQENDTEKPKTPDEPLNDMHFNFNLNITPDCTLKLLMDPKAGDYINLSGSGRLLASYYNKGKFQMYGTFRVDHGIYKMSIQDVIHKDFVFQKDGTIVFGGDAYQAALNLKASYTVPNVSLDDLSATGLGLSNTRVDCIMNLGGKASAPMVTFDFDLPNANEDEKQMVRSMVSTEEERNMQVIYLLGIGRFYSYNTQYITGSSQGTTAVNSLLSSTLASQFNQMLSNVMGSNKWSFGANLRTGETGWDQLDVEGMLSGRLLNNRLLLNGNFGYRESYYSTNNFIGDFDVQYLLTPSGGISLKAYNQTNDRYFIQSSLTTQGIGIQFKKDFNRWKELLRGKKKKNKK